MESQHLRIVESTWYGSGPLAGAARRALWPLARAYGLATAARNALFDSGMLRVDQPALPTVSVGNLTVGGTGKTPVAAWIAARLQGRAHTAIALRGYGDDEAEVHRRLNPDIPVVVNADRGAAIRSAQEQGAEVVVLDDAFQHRKIARSADVVLLSAEQLMRPLRLLPAGPWREPLDAARRADLLVITRKSAARGDAIRARDKLRATFPGLPIVTVHLAPHSLVSVDGGAELPLKALDGAAVTGIAAIGEPGVFARQLEQLGARVSMNAFRDHHVFTDAEIRDIAERVPMDGHAVCTLKDAVKLSRRWPGPSRLWYLSQQLAVEDGGTDMETLLQRVLDTRTSAAIAAG